MSQKGNTLPEFIAWQFLMHPAASRVGNCNGSLCDPHSNPPDPPIPFLSQCPSLTPLTLGNSVHRATQMPWPDSDRLYSENKV